MNKKATIYKITATVNYRWKYGEKTERINKKKSGKSFGSIFSVHLSYKSFKSIELAEQLPTTYPYNDWLIAP